MNSRSQLAPRGRALRNSTFAPLALRDSDSARAVSDHEGQAMRDLIVNSRGPGVVLSYRAVIGLFCFKLIQQMNYLH